MTDKEIEDIYALVRQFHAEYLQQSGVRLPALRSSNGNFTVDALTLIYLAQEYPNTRWVSKSELTQFIRQFHPDTNDVQSARHLGMQSGFYIVSTRRGNFLPEDNPPPRGRTSHYLLRTLEEPHPSFIAERRGGIGTDFERVKQHYGYRCATCGSKEGEPNLRYKRVRTELQQSHRNPKLPLEKDNIIPQCQFCNRADRNYWVYDKRGRVVGIADVRPIKKSIREGYLDEQQVESLYHYLKRRLEERKRGG